MINSAANPSDPDTECTLGSLAEALSEAWKFYRRLDGNDPNYRESTGWDAPEIARCRRVLKTACGDEGVDEVSVNGVCWQRVTMPAHEWFAVDVPRDPNGAKRSHHHTTFEFDGHVVHVDYIRRSTSGPGSGVNDFQFFVDGEFVSRGGHSFTVPAVIPRGEPAAMYWNNHLFICQRTLSHWGVPHPSWFTLWKRVQRDGANLTS